MSYIAETLSRPYGPLLLLAQDAARYPEKPLILLLHGAYEKHKKLLPWAELWRACRDTALADLPGHGQSAATAAITFDAYVDELRWLLTNRFADRRVIIVGDSFGGLLGIALGNAPPANLAGVIALDPLISTAQQWSLQDLMPRVLDGQPEDGFRRSFARNVMGMNGAVAEDRRYHHFIEGVKAPALVLAGAEPLGLRRAVTGPSLLSDDDRAFLRKHVNLGVIPDVGHQLVLQRPAETFAAAKAFADTLA